MVNMTIIKQSREKSITDSLTSLLINAKGSEIVAKGECLSQNEALGPKERQPYGGVKLTVIVFPILSQAIL
jgi:hypothetical protein